MVYTTHKKNLAKLPENSIKLIVMRVPSGINFISNTNIYWKPELSPNKDLMYKFKFEKKISFDDFEKEFKKQISKNDKSNKLLKKIANASNKQDIFLICTEIDRTMCHRSILGEILNEKYNVEVNEW